MAAPMFLVYLVTTYKVVASSYVSSEKIRSFEYPAPGVAGVVNESPFSFIIFMSG